MARAVVTLCVLAVVLAAGASGAASATEVAYRDAKGENPSGPDITTVTASSDGTELTLRIAVPTNPVFTRDMRLTMFLDADDDRGTGLTGSAGGPLEGWDYAMYVDPLTYQDDGAHLLTCVGGVNVCGIPESAPDYSYSGGATITLSAPSLGLSRIERVRFYASIRTGVALAPGTGFDFTNSHYDRAPDEGFWTFDAQRLQVTTVRATPAQPRAGRPFALTMGVQRSDTGAVLTRGDVKCLLRVGGKPVAPRTRRFVGRLATCGFVVPAGATRERYRATIAVEALGRNVARSVSGRVS